MKKSKKAFTFTEIIVVIVILVILSTITFISYNSNLSYSRNTVRINDMGNIKMSLKNHKLKNSSYPLPGNIFNITNSGVIIRQGFLNENVYTQEIVKKPTDPLVKGQYYTYSITNNNLFFQIAMSLEEGYNMRAYVDGDYQTLNHEFIPSIVFAAGSGGTIQTLSGSFIVDKGTLNLPYDENGNIIKNASNLNQILLQNGINIPKFYGFSSCIEIYENGYYMGIGTYKILSSTGLIINTNCSF